MSNVRLLNRLLYSFLLVLLLPGSVVGLAPGQKKVYDSGINRFNVADQALTCGATLDLVGADNPEKIWNFLTGKGLTPEQAAGVMGNLQRESGFNPGADEPDNSAGPGGYGIAQWTGNRRDALFASADAQGVSVDDLGFQLNYLYDESNQRKMRDDPNTPEWVGLTRVATVEDAMLYWEYNFERAGVRALGQRLSFANDILVRFGSGTTNTPIAGASGQDCGLVDANGCPIAAVSESDLVTVEGIKVHPCISAEVERIVQLGRQEGYDLSGWGWRSNESQIRLRIEHGCGGSRLYDPTCTGSPPTAVPGRSRHERGTAVDFTCGGGSISSRSHPCFIFLSENTGLKNLPSEPWHWSVDGH